MRRWDQIVGAGILAAASLSALAWGAPRPNGVESYAHPSASGGKEANGSHANFAGKLPISELNEDEAILHALNRLGFGPRPGQVEQIEKTGLENWIQAQLHPENIADPVMDARLAQFPRSALERRSTARPVSAAGHRRQALGMKVEEYQKHLQDLAKQPGGISSLPFKDQNEIVNDADGREDDPRGL